MIEIVVTTTLGETPIRVDTYAELAETLVAIKSGKYIVLDNGVLYVNPAHIIDINVDIDKNDLDYKNNQNNLALALEGAKI